MPDIRSLTWNDQIVEQSNVPFLISLLSMTSVDTCCLLRITKSFVHPIRDPLVLECWCIHTQPQILKAVYLYQLKRVLQNINGEKRIISFSVLCYILLLEQLWILMGKCGVFCNICLIYFQPTTVGWKKIPCNFQLHGKCSYMVMEFLNLSLLLQHIPFLYKWANAVMLERISRFSLPLQTASHFGQ